MTILIHAPFTAEQVTALNAWQAAGWVHPFTCGRCRDAEMEQAIAAAGGVPGCFIFPTGQRALVATEDGWVCPTCDYRQDCAQFYGSTATQSPFRERKVMTTEEIEQFRREHPHGIQPHIIPGSSVDDLFETLGGIPEPDDERPVEDLDAGYPFVGDEEW